jgi:tetratricopeptide (TPR) repeat protein
MKDRRLRALLPFFVAALTAVVFLPILHNGFVLRDDPAVIVDNPYFRGLGWMQIRWMFTTFYMSLYRPLAWMTLGIDYLASGLNPVGYHATSLLLHAANAALVYCVALRFYRIARKETAGQPAPGEALAAAFAALFFALHPLAAEPVAWASAVSDPLAALFFLLSLLCYLAAVSESYRSGWIAAAWPLYGLSLLSKASMVTFPIVLLVLDVYPLKRLGGARKWLGPETTRVWLEKIPFFALSAAAALLAVLSKSETGAIWPWTWANLLQPLYALGFYLAKTIWPIHLSVSYPLEVQRDLWQWRFAPMPALAIAATAAAISLRRRLPSILVAWMSIALLLLPSSGIVGYGIQIVADRYGYIANAVAGVLIGAGILYVQKRRPRRIVLTSSAAAALLLSFAILTHRQILVWYDSESLFRQAVAVAPDFVLAQHGLGGALVIKKRFDEAAEHYRQALAIADYAYLHYDLGRTLARQGSVEEAIAEYRSALRLDAAYRPAREHLALLLIQQGRNAEAEYRETLRIDPAFVEAHNNLAFLLATRGRLDEAVALYRQAIKLDEESALLHANLANVLLKSGNVEEAASEFRRALQLDPNLPPALTGLKRAVSEKKK